MHLGISPTCIPCVSTLQVGVFFLAAFSFISFAHDSPPSPLLTIYTADHQLRSYTTLMSQESFLELGTV